jgi:plasmid stabilization system protein ParE
MKYRIELVGSSRTDLLEIKKYLSQFYPGTVKRFAIEFNKHKKMILENPYMYQVYEPAPQYRRAIVGDYLVFYKVFDPAENQVGLVEVHSILRASWNIEKHIKSEDTQ